MKLFALKVLLIVCVLLPTIEAAPAQPSPISVQRDRYIEVLREHRVKSIRMWQVRDSLQPPAPCDIWDTTLLAYDTNWTTLTRIRRDNYSPVDGFDDDLLAFHDPICERDTFIKPDTLIQLYDRHGFVIQGYRSTREMRGAWKAYFNDQHRVIAQARYDDNGLTDSSYYHFDNSGRKTKWINVVRYDEDIGDFVPDGEQPKPRPKKQLPEWETFTYYLFYDSLGRFIGDSRNPDRIEDPLPLIEGTANAYWYRSTLDKSTRHFDSLIFDEFGNHVGTYKLKLTAQDTFITHYTNEGLDRHEDFFKISELNRGRRIERDPLGRPIRLIERQRDAISRITETSYLSNGLIDEKRIFRPSKNGGPLELKRRFKYLYEFY